MLYTHFIGKITSVMYILGLSYSLPYLRPGRGELPTLSFLVCVMRYAHEYLSIYPTVPCSAPGLAKAKLGMFWRLKYDYQRVYEYGMDEVTLGKYGGVTDGRDV